MNGMRKRGSALVAVLIMGLVLFTLLKALIILSHGNAFRAMTYQNRVLAGYALEAGVADAMTQLKSTPGWTAGFSDKPLRNGHGTYTVEFAPASATPGPTDSVNNLTGVGVVDGPRGAATVLPGTAEIVVIAQVNGVRRQALVVVAGSSGSTLSNDMIAAHNILMRGNVKVDGIADLETGAAVDAGLHSQVGGGASNTVVWAPILGTEILEVAGTVSSVSTNPAAVDLASGAPAGGIQLGAAMQAAPNIDIAARIDGATGTAPTVAGGGTLTSGNWKISGDLNVVGDLVLEPGSKLYVDGNLNVLGSISGTGEIYVKGNTKLEGDIRLTSADGVGLFSKGSVELSGFNTAAYMSNVLASDPGAQSVADAAMASLAEVQCLFDTNNTSQLLEGNAEHDLLHDELDRLTGSAGGEDLLGQMIDKFQSEPPGPSRDAVIAKLQDLKRMASEETGNDPVPDWYSGANQEPGVIENAMHQGDPALLREVLTCFTQSSTEDLGNTFFQGTVYTDGYLYASNSVTVVGAVYATGRNTTITPVTIDGQIVERGDIFLNRDVRLTMNQKAVEALGGPVTVSGGSLSLKSWLEL